MKIFMRVFLLLIIIAGQMAWPAGEKEKVAVERGEYIVAKGRIIPPDEIYEDSYVSAVDFQYPDPEEAFGVRFFSGNRQVSTRGQDEIILIGIQGRRFTYDDLPIMNQAFVIDKSGSMYKKDKMNWVKEAFDVYMNKIREKDFVSLIVFDDTARVVFPSTQMKGETIRERFSDAVHSIIPGGGSDMMSALQLGYKEVLSNYHKDYANQLLFLTDGVGFSEEIYEMAAAYREIGINVTAIGLGEDCDLTFIDTLADWGGGGARFIASREKMEEIFGSEFVQTVVPAARDVEIELYCLQNLKDVTAWGYHAEIERQWDNYENQDGKPPVPYGITVDSAGNVYIVDDENNRIQKFDRSGNFVAEWGRKGIRKWDREVETKADEVEGKFYRPRGIAVDPSGYIYVADSGNTRIQKFDGNGNFIIQWGGPGRGKGKFKEPIGVAVDSRGYIYVADSGNNLIQKFDGNGNFITQWGGAGSEDGQFNAPAAVTTDVYRNVYVADSLNNRVQIFESNGTYITKIDSSSSGGGVFSPTGIAVDINGNIYVADSKSKKIHKFDIDGKFVSMWGSYGSEDRTFGDLTAVSVDPAGNIYAADSVHNNIQKFDSAGIIMIKQPIRFSLSTVNLGDFETIVIKAKLPAQDSEGSKSIARLKVSYTDMDGKRVQMPPTDLIVEFVNTKNPTDGISNATVLRAATMLHYAQALKRIGKEYYAGNIKSSLHMTNEIKKELLNARERLGDVSFENELTVLEKYIDKMGIESGLSEEETTMIVQDRELVAVSYDRDIHDHLNNLFREIMLDLQAREGGNIALLGFSFPDNRQTEILNLLDKTAESYLYELSHFKVLERETINEILIEQDLALSDMMDTNKAIEVGEGLSANYILTGSIIEMRESVVIFCRVVNVETAVIESVGQVIVPRNEEVNAML
jgi:DNA-binding beta-propeller fold protein YncE